MAKLDKLAVARLLTFIKERYKIFTKKSLGKPKPWTHDPILQQYSFCNVHRENDKVTVWITQRWRKSHTNEDDVWFAMVVARYINWPETLDSLSYPVPFKSEHFIKVLETRKQNDMKVYTGAYMVHSNGGGSKAEYIANKVLQPMWLDRKKIRPTETDTLKSFYDRLREYQGMGSFMAAQVVADVKYTGNLLGAKDWWTWAAVGPGSARGLNRVCGRDKDAKWQPGEWLETLQELADRLKPHIYEADIPRLHAQDLQNCLCEFDKIERTRMGEGRPRATYPGKE